MIVIKPVEITEANLISSTIAEPDVSQGEVEYLGRSNSITLSSTPVGGSLASHGSNILRLSFSGGIYETHTITRDLITTTNNGQLTLSDGVPVEVAELDGTVYVLSSTGKVFALTDNYTEGSLLITLPAVPADGWAGFGFFGGSAWLCEATDGASLIGEIGLYDQSTGAESGVIYLAAPVEIDSISYGEELGYFVAAADKASGYELISIDSNGIETSGFKLGVIYKSNSLAFNGPNLISTVNGSAFYRRPDLAWAINVSDLKIENRFATGDRYIKTSTHKLYEAATNTIDDPEVGASKDTPTWIDVSPTNKYAAFDEVVGTQSISDTTQIIEITPNAIFGGLSVINMTGVNSVNVTVTDPIDGEVYNRDIQMLDNSEIVNWYNYLWTEIIAKSEFVLLDLPSYFSATIKITFTGGLGMGVGVVVVGPVAYLGVTDYGTNVQQLDFSLYEEDQFGNLKITPRPYAKLVNFKNTVQKENLNYVYNQLEQLRGVAAVWVGDETNEHDLTLVYGSHRDNTLNIDTPTACNVPLQIRGRT